MRLQETAEEGKDQTNNKTKQATKRNVKWKPWFLSFRGNSQL